MVDGRGADEPDGGIEDDPTLPTRDHVINVEQLILVDRKQECQFFDLKRNLLPITWVPRYY